MGYKELPETCPCGRKMAQVIAYRENQLTKVQVPFRKGWYCVPCKVFVAALGRETFVEAQ